MRRSTTARHGHPSRRRACRWARRASAGRTSRPSSPRCRSS